MHDTTNSPTNCQTRIKAQLQRWKLPWGMAKTETALRRALETLWDTYAVPDPAKSLSTALAQVFAVLSNNHYTLWQEVGSKLSEEDDQVMSSLVSLHNPRLLDRLESTLHTIGELHPDADMAAVAFVFWSSLKLWRNGWADVIDFEVA